MKDNKIIIDSPVKGQWAVMNPPGHPKQAYDLLTVDDRKSPYKHGYFLRHIFSFISVEDTLAWSQPVYAPLDGVIMECNDSTPDRERINMIYDLIKLLVLKPKKGSPFSAYGGNYVMLKCSACYILLCHFKHGSLRVKTGDTVRSGDQLGAVGNSGSSLQPHLHFQVMEDEHIFPLFKNLIPCALRSAQKRVSSKWKAESNTLLNNGDYLML